MKTDTEMIIESGDRDLIVSELVKLVILITGGVPALRSPSDVMSTTPMVVGTLLNARAMAKAIK